MGRRYYRQQAEEIECRQLEALYNSSYVATAWGKPFYAFFMDESIDQQKPAAVLPVDIFNNRIINGAVSLVVTFFIPFVLLNYLLLFANDNYESVLKKYHGMGGKLYRKYVLLTISILAIPVIIVAFYFKEV